MKITLKRTLHVWAGTLWAGRPYEAKKTGGMWLARVTSKNWALIRDDNVLHVLD